MHDPADLVDPSTMTAEDITKENAARRAFNEKMENVDPVPLIRENP